MYKILRRSLTITPHCRHNAVLNIFIVTVGIREPLIGNSINTLLNKLPSETTLIQLFSWPMIHKFQLDIQPYRNISSRSSIVCRSCQRRLRSLLLSCHFTRRGAFNIRVGISSASNCDIYQGKDQRKRVASQRQRLAFIFPWFLYLQGKTNAPALHRRHDFAIVLSIHVEVRLVNFMGNSVKQSAKALNSWTVEGGIAALCLLLKWSAALLTTIGFPYQCSSDISHDFAQVFCNRPQRSVWVEVNASWQWCLARSLSL